MSPTEVWCDWFRSLAPAVAGELAVTLMRLYPGGLLQSTLYTDNPTDGFEPRVRRLAAASPSMDAGVAITVAALTDYVFLERNSTERWDQNREMLELLDEAQQEHLGGDEALSDWIEDNKLRHPLRSRLWLKEADRWREVRSGPLDPEAISRAMFELMTER